MVYADVVYATLHFPWIIIRLHLIPPFQFQHTYSLIKVLISSIPPRFVRGLYSLVILLSCLTSRFDEKKTRQVAPVADETAVSG